MYKDSIFLLQTLSALVQLITLSCSLCLVCGLNLKVSDFKMTPLMLWSLGTFGRKANLIVLLFLHFLLLVKDLVSGFPEYSSCNMGYLNSVLSSSSQVHAADDAPVTGGGLRLTSFLICHLSIDLSYGQMFLFYFWSLLLILTIIFVGWVLFILGSWIEFLLIISTVCWITYS